MQVITLATPAILPQAQVLARSLRTHQPDWSHEVLLVGRARDTGPAAGSLHVRPAAEALGEQLDLDIDRLIARYDDDELLPLLRPPALRVSVRSKPGPGLHLPPSTWAGAALKP